MAPRKIEMGLALVLVTILCSRATAQLSCMSVIISLSPCLNYVTGNSTTPSSSCCSQLALVVRSQPRCLCSIINGGGSTLGISINRTQALALPRACNVKTPPISQCNIVGGPTISPAEAPTETAARGFSSPTIPPIPKAPSGHSPVMPLTPSLDGTPPVPSPTMPTTPSMSNSPSETGSKATSSNGSSTNFSLSPLFFVLFVVSYVASTVTNFRV